MKIGHTIDVNGFYTGDVIQKSGVVPDVTEICPDGFHKPKWDGTAWVEGITPEELGAIPTNPPTIEQRLEAAEQALLAVMEVMV
jgi:hypothetical protein